MSPIGRIFIVLNLLLSAAFLGWAANALGAAEDLQAALAAEKEAHASAVAAKDSEISALNIDVSTLKDDQRTFQGERDDLKAERDRLQGQLDEQNRENSTLKAQLAEITATLGDFNDSITQMGQAKDAAVQRAHDAEAAQAAAEAAAQAAEFARRDAEEAQANAELKLSDLTAEHAALRSELDETKNLLQQLVQKYNVDLSQIEAVPQIEAAVLQYNADLEPGLATLNVGSNDGVQPGFKFHIYRGNQYKGQVRVEDVEEEYCSAIVVGQAKGTIEQGDRASTVL